MFNLFKKNVKKKYPVLNRLMTAYFNMDWMIDFKTENDVVIKFCDDFDPTLTNEKLNVEIKEILSCPPRYFFDLEQNEIKSSGLNFQNSDEAYAWLQKIHKYLMEYLEKHKLGHTL